MQFSYFICFIVWQRQKLCVIRWWWWKKLVHQRKWKMIVMITLECIRETWKCISFQDVFILSAFFVWLPRCRISSRIVHHVRCVVWRNVWVANKMHKSMLKLRREYILFLYARMRICESKENTFNAITMRDVFASSIIFMSFVYLCIKFFGYECWKDQKWDF